ncbi:MAG: DegT/DnrJ/EryC1/StrS family aminotransferase [Solirubrobacteraceae bacterium]
MSAPLIPVYPPFELSLRRGSPGFPLDRPGLRLTHLGRGAVWLALRALGIGEGSRVAMPAYHCGSEVEAVRLAGARIDFYRVDAHLVPDPDDLARAAREADLTYLISHFGFPIAQAPGGARVLEDAAHALFSLDADGRPVGSRGDAAVFCPRKSLGVPDGGAVLVDSLIPAAPRPPGKRIARSTAALLAGRAAISRAAPVHAAATRLIARASRGDAAARAGNLTETIIGEWDLEVADMENAARLPARLTELAVRHAGAPAIRARRRENYLRLRDELADHVPEAYRELPAGTCPLYLPVRAADRAAALRGLLDHGIRALEIWPVAHPLLDRRRFAELEPARRELLALPTHHLLAPWHTEAVAAAAKRVLENR